MNDDTDLIAALNRVASELPPELGVVWMRFCGRMTAPRFAYVERAKHHYVDVYRSVRRPMALHATATFKGQSTEVTGTPQEVVRAVAEFFQACTEAGP